ncbi:TPA_asm: N [Fraxinus gammacytorhabdovirus 1]|nr:TPA_asm: N [Fraxinus gammacytorhabdovirus 1]
MAFPANLIDIRAINPIPAYAQIANALPTPQGEPDADWTNNDVNRVNFWHGTTLNDAQVLTTGQEWIAEIEAGTISARTAAKGLKLAMSLKSMEAGANNFLLSQAPRGEALNEGVPALVNMPGIEMFGSTPFTMRAQQVVVGPIQPLLPVAAVAAPANVNVQEPEIPQGEDTEAEKRHAYTFLAAYMMKLLIKSADNILLGVPNMRNRFESFYGPARAVTGFRLNMEKASAYKEALLSQGNILTTYTMALAYTQSAASANHSVREKGVLSYLGYLPFSYSGLHAYTLMIELKNFTNIGLDRLLSLFQADINSPALLKITHIIRHLERTVAEPERATYFRYCAHWSPRYFSILRSRKCAYLLYTVACAWKILSAGHENADPERIVAVNTLSDSMKRTLKIAGEIIGESLKQNMLGGAGSSIAYTLAMAAPRQAAAPAEEAWPNIN